MAPNPSLLLLLLLLELLFCASAEAPPPRWGGVLEAEGAAAVLVVVEVTMEGMLPPKGEAGLLETLPWPLLLLLPPLLLLLQGGRGNPQSPRLLLKDDCGKRRSDAGIGPLSSLKERSREASSGMAMARSGMGPERLLRWR
jgi:hypothetical protein